MTVFASSGTDTGSGFGDKLRDALGQSEGGKKRAASKRRVKTGDKNLTWSDDQFGMLVVTTPELTMNTSEGNGTNHWARLYHGNKVPPQIVLEFAATAKDGVRVLDIKGGGDQFKDVTGSAIEPMIVNIEWNGDKPHTRKRYADNFDLLFLRPDGDFLQLQVSLSSRAGRLWVAAQEIYRGQVVRTSHSKAAGLGITTHKNGSHAAFVVPLAGVNAYPGADYLQTFNGMGPKIVDYAIGHGAVAPLSECVVADDWSPIRVDLPEVMKKKRWKTAAVTFYNVVTGVGRAICEDGKLCFIHFSAIIDENGRPLSSQDQFPVLESMKEVAIRYKDEGGQRKATAVRII